MIKMICPVCKKGLGNVPHYKRCNPKNLTNEELRQSVFEFNYRPFIEDHQDDIKQLYCVDQISIADLSKKYSISWGRMQQILKYIEIDVRTLSEAASTDRTRKKYQKTCLSKYGSTNALSKNTKAYHKKNLTVLSRYGVSNVRKLQSTKDKINSTMMSRYGVNRIVKLPKFSKNTPNKLESRISSCLTYLGIPHKFSHYVKRKQFDFLITGTKILFEVNGDFWHANPKFYKDSDEIKFVQGIKSVKSIWKQDADKIEIARSYGYTVISLWENDINSKTDENLRNWILAYLG